MIKSSSLIAGLFVALTLGALPVQAAENVLPPKENWSFAGPFGTYDKAQLQRGFQVYREICSACHGMRLVAFRNLSEPGGPGFTEGQVKALAAEYQIADPAAENGARPGVAADRWPNPFATDQDARDANGGALPPDFSLIAKARGVNEAFPMNFVNYFRAYSEAGPDYLHALLTGYEEDVPAEFAEDFPEGKYFNHYFPGHAIGMAPPLSDGLVEYEDPAFPTTVDQYSRDVASFLMWAAEPHLVARKEAGLQIILFLVLFAGLMYMVKRKLWAPLHAHEPKKADKTA